MAEKMDPSNSSMKDKVYQVSLKSYATFNDMHLSKGFFKHVLTSQNYGSLNTKQIYKIYRVVVQNQNFIATVTFLGVLLSLQK